MQHWKGTRYYRLNGLEYRTFRIPNVLCYSITQDIALVDRRKLKRFLRRAGYAVISLGSRPTLPST